MACHTMQPAPDLGLNAWELVCHTKPPDAVLHRKPCDDLVNKDSMKGKQYLRSHGLRNSVYQHQTIVLGNTTTSILSAR